MAIIELSYKNKSNNIETNLIYSPSSSYKINPNEVSNKVHIKLFKYDYKGVLPPSILNINDKTFIVPGWIEVIGGTTLNDINWIKPKYKIDNNKNVEIFKFKSSKGDKEYTTKKYILNNGDVKYTCNCLGSIRAKDRKCTHIKSLELKHTKTPLN